jgi:hypothetical protein
VVILTKINNVSNNAGEIPSSFDAGLNRAKQNELTSIRVKLQLN